MARPLCIYHGNCADGFAAAWVVRLAMNEEVDFHAGVYQNSPPDVAGRDVVIVDFSYKRPVLEQMIASARSLLVIDHHKTAAADLSFLRAAFDEDWQTHLASEKHKALAVFDMERSGAGLTWDFFFVGQPRPPLINTIEDRDLWRFKLPRTREIQACLFSYEYDFRVWDELMAQTDLSAMAAEGAAIERKHHKDIAELVKVCKRRMVIGEHDVPVASLPYTLTSDAGHLMAHGEPFAACYWDTEDGRNFSLRATDDGIDVSEIAKLYGGGGHARAAGFKVPRHHVLAIV